MRIQGAELPVKPTTGYSANLRQRLRLRREHLGITQQAAADMIAKEAGLDGMTKATLSKWETFQSHPRVDMFAAWARALGLRLYVDLRNPDDGRQHILVSEEVGRLASLLEDMAPEDRAALTRIIEGIPRR
jgi:transcriptional regulator with XRE-family HTH domain